VEKGQKEAIGKAIQQQAKDGRLTCTQAFKAAEEFNVTPKHIGEIADELKIKIIRCQLGCF